ncbi:uncharacterized protein LOC120331668 [Styela clava]
MFFEIANLPGGFFFMASGWPVPVDLCNNSTGVFEYDDKDSFSHKWNMTANNCVYNESALILRLNTISLTYNGDCKASLKISAFQNDRELCKLQGSCFVVVSANSSLSNRSLIDGCIPIFQDPIFPVVIDFQKKNRQTMTLSIAFEYIMNEENISETSSPTAPTKMVTTHAEPVSTSDLPQNSSSIDCTPSIILGILLGFMSIALLAVVIRNQSLKRKLQAENVNSQKTAATLEIAGGSGEQNPYDFANEEVAGASINAPAYVPDAVYSVVNKQAKKSAMQQ